MTPSPLVTALVSLGVSSPEEAARVLTYYASTQLRWGLPLRITRWKCIGPKQKIAPLLFLKLAYLPSCRD